MAPGRLRSSRSKSTAQHLLRRRCTSAARRIQLCVRFTGGQTAHLLSSLPGGSLLIQRAHGSPTHTCYFQPATVHTSCNLKRVAPAASTAQA